MILKSSMGKLDGLDMQSVSGISTFGGAAILESFLEELDGLYMEEPVSTVLSVREVLILISSMEIEGWGLA